MMSKVVFVVILSFLIAAEANTQDEPIIDFYLSQLDSTFQSEYIFVSDANFSVEVQSIMIKTDYRGEIDKVDTAIYKVYYSGEIDSVSIIDSALTLDENILPEKFFFNPPWYEENIFFFYPNDTGGAILAIGFRPDSAFSDTVVTGFLNMDRYDYKLKSIFMHDPDPEEYDNISHVFYFGPRDDYQIILSYEIQGLKQALLGKLFFKQKFEFTKYVFYN